MSGIETTYRGHLIRYNDNRDEWYCSDVENSNASLSKIKASIDKMYRDIRMKSSFDVFEMSRGSEHSNPALTPATIVEFVKTKIDRKVWKNPPTIVEDHFVAVVARRRGNERAARREANINELMPATPEAEEAWGKYVIACEGLRAAHALAERSFRAIPRIALEDIAALKAIKENEKDDTDAEK